MTGIQEDRDPWGYATYEGAERLRHQQTAGMTLSERLEALDEMISLAAGLHAGKISDPDVLEGFGQPDSE